jgi:ribonuclease HI|tara:strand:+ start:1230 stop:1715 length:486 start_codon:yes stop_codon:yes gene_type:complete
MLLKSPPTYDAYVDGSFSAKFDTGSWAYTIVESDQDVSIGEASGLIDYALQPELKKLRNIATECQAVIHSLEYASQHGCKLNIHYDYIGLERWVWDITDNQTPWQCKNDFTWDYRQTVIEYEQYINKMIWVKGHAGNKWNEYTDDLATRLTGTNLKTKTTI